MTNERELNIGPDASAVLRRAGFVRRGACWVRDVEPIRMLVEPQRAVYAERLTLNLGLRIRTLSPVLPWISSRGPTLMGEAQRWTRLGRVGPEGRDQWWDLSSEPRAALADLARALHAHGLPWLRSEARPDPFLRFCEARRARTATELDPEGGFDELRLSIAVRCWRGEVDEAARLLEFARRAWRVEHGRLEHARRDFERSRERGGALQPVPQLLAELEGLVGRAASD